MYVVAGATGRVGSQIASQLLETGAAVRVLVRRSEDAHAWASRGAQPHIVDLRDHASLTEALAGCRGLFTLLPFDLMADDLDAHADALITSIAAAVTTAAPAHVVMLSSGGADREQGTGPITGLHRLEQALDATGTRISALRPGHFQEKVSEAIDAARALGIYPVFAPSATIEIPMVATADIATAAVRQLQAPPPATETVDIIGPAYTEAHVAQVLGAALGRRLQVVVLPEESWTDTLIGAGFRPHIARSLAQLYRADARGLLAPRGDRRISTTTPIDVTVDQLVRDGDQQ